MEGNLGELPPYVCATVFPHAFVVESVYGCDLSRFVVAADQRYSVWVANFEAEEEEEGFEGVETAVNEVACTLLAISTCAWIL